jgi:hypothetical protein
MVSFVSLWCLLTSSKFTYLFLCYLVFFVFGVLKFLECVLYILVDQSNTFSMYFSDFFFNSFFEGIVEFLYIYHCFVEVRV